MSYAIERRIAAALEAVVVSEGETADLRAKFPGNQEWWVSATANGWGGLPELLRRLAKMRGLPRYRSGFLALQDFCCVRFDDAAEALKVEGVLRWLQKNFWAPRTDAVVHGWTTLVDKPAELVYETLEADGQEFRLRV